MNKGRFLIYAVLLMTIILVAGAARADSIQVIFNIAGTNDPPTGTGPWGTMDLVLNGSAIDLTFNMADGLMIGQIGFNVVGSTKGFHITGGGAEGGATDVDPGYCFWFFLAPGGIGCFDGIISYYPQDMTSSGSLTITRMAGFQSVYDLVGLSTQGDVAVNFGVTIFVENGGPFDGYAGGMAASPVPEPSSLFLLSSGALGVIGAIRRKLLS